MEEEQTITQSQAERIKAMIMQEFPGVVFREVPLVPDGGKFFFFDFPYPKFSSDEAQITVKRMKARMKEIAEEEKIITPVILDRLLQQQYVMSPREKQAERISIAEFAKSIEAPPFAAKIHELIEQNLWEQAKIEEKIAIQKIAGMWEIVKEVATTHSTYYDENGGWYECPFCYGGNNNSEPDKIKHEDDCIVFMARKLVLEREARDNE